jgi:hypothetical protein
MFRGKTYIVSDTSREWKRIYYVGDFYEKKSM